MKKGGLGQHIGDQLGGFTHVTYLDPKEKGLVWDILMIFFYHSSTYSECLILTPGHLMILMILFRAWTQPVKHWQLQVSGLHSRAYQESPILSWRIISDLWISDNPPEEKLTTQNYCKPFKNGIGYGDQKPSSRCEQFANCQLPAFLTEHPHGPDMSPGDFGGVLAAANYWDNLLNGSC